MQPNNSTFYNLKHYHDCWLYNLSSSEKSANPVESSPTIRWEDQVSASQFSEIKEDHLQEQLFGASWQQLCFVDFSCLVGHKIITFLLWPCLPLLSSFRLAASHQNFWANQSQESTLLILFVPSDHIKSGASSQGGSRWILFLVGSNNVNPGWQCQFMSVTLPWRIF